MDAFGVVFICVTSNVGSLVFCFFMNLGAPARKQGKNTTHYNAVSVRFDLNLLEASSPSTQEKSVRTVNLPPYSCNILRTYAETSSLQDLIRDRLRRVNIRDTGSSVGKLAQSAKMPLSM